MRAGIANELVIERQLSSTFGIVTGGDLVFILTNKIKKGVLKPVASIGIQHFETDDNNN